MSFGLSASDCVALPSFAWQVYKTCRDSSSDYAELSSEVASLHAVLCEVNALVGQYSLSEESIKRVGLVLKGCRDVLKSIETQLARYKSLGTNKKRMRDRTRWAMETVGDARIRLLSHTAMLSLLLSSLVGGSFLSADEASNRPVRLAMQDLTVSSPETFKEDPKRSLSPTGIRMPCLRCKILDMHCARGILCPSCDNIWYNARGLPCRRGPLKSLARDLIPTFLLPCESSCRRDPLVCQHLGVAIGDRPINVQWGLIELQIPLGTPIRDLYSAISFKAPEAMSRFQQTYPDRYQFRVKLIDEALRYESHHPKSASIIAEARQFLILSLLISHVPLIQPPGAASRAISTQDGDDLHEFVHDELQFVLASLLESCLRGLLDKLQETMSKRRRTDWLAVCFGLSLMFFAAESLQVDIHLRSVNAQGSCESMEMRSIYVLAELFLASTLSFDPLSLDWTRAENAALVENDVEAIESFKVLQALTQDYWGFLHDRQIIQYDYHDTDCLTGKLVSRILCV